MMLTANAYDPDEPEGAGRGSSYLSPKDLKWILLTLAVLSVIFWPVFQHMRKQSEKARCLQNVKAVFDAALLYMQYNDEHLPPVYAVGQDGTPLLTNGLPNTWATLLQPNMTARASFRCPSAKDDEVVRVEHPDSSKKVIELTYGMYVAMDTMYYPQLENPNGTVLFAETSNMGAGGTYDPSPFKLRDGTVVPFDGFLIGYDDGNREHSENSKTVTRLAFGNTANGEFNGDRALPRHDTYIHVLFASGRAGRLEPSAARLQHLTPELTGYWSTR